MSDTVIARNLLHAARMATRASSMSFESGKLYRWPGVEIVEEILKKDLKVSVTDPRGNKITKLDSYYDPICDELKIFFKYPEFAHLARLGEFIEEMKHRKINIRLYIDPV